jgi:hypothetical protein
MHKCTKIDGMDLGMKDVSILLQINPDCVTAWHYYAGTQFCYEGEERIL